MRAEEMGANVELRTELETATTLTDPQQYRAEIERLRSVYGHNITVLPHDYRAVPQPSCYAFALGLASNAQYLQLVAASAGPDGVQPLASAGMMMLLEARALRRRRAAPRYGDVVLYFGDDERVQHAGEIIDASCRIRSKWGQAEVHEHDLWEVPLNYGNIADTFLPTSPERILALLEQPP